MSVWLLVTFVWLRVGERFGGRIGTLVGARGAAGVALQQQVGRLVAWCGRLGGVLSSGDALLVAGVRRGRGSLRGRRRATGPTPGLCERPGRPDAQLLAAATVRAAHVRRPPRQDQGQVEHLLRHPAARTPLRARQSRLGAAAAAAAPGPGPSRVRPRGPPSRRRPAAVAVRPTARRQAQAAGVGVRARRPAAGGESDRLAGLGRGVPRQLAVYGRPGLLRVRAGGLQADEHPQELPRPHPQAKEEDETDLNVSDATFVGGDARFDLVSSMKYHVVVQNNSSITAAE